MRLAPTYAFDVAISAVRYDAILVAELSQRLSERLVSPAVWAGHAPEDGPGAQSALFADISRVVVVLHQRLWHHDLLTQSDEATLHQRIRARPESVVVIALDDAPPAEALDGADACSINTVGLDGVVAFILHAIDACGGGVLAYERPVVSVTEAPVVRWGDTPLPYLRQPRALSSLRREFDALLDAADAPAGDSGGAVDAIEITALPNRLVARIGEMALSFSWMPDRNGLVGDGRLLVIEWNGALADGRGALRAAAMTRECVYRPESSGPDHWQWREDTPHGRAHSSADLVAQWLACASVAQAVANARRTEDTFPLV